MEKDETEYLLENPANAAKLRESIAQYDIVDQYDIETCPYDMVYELIHAEYKKGKLKGIIPLNDCYIKYQITSSQDEVISGNAEIIKDKNGK